MSSPGAGKTTLLVHTLAHLRQSAPVSSRATSRPRLDADRLAGLGAQVALLNTAGFGGECHLDAPMVACAPSVSST
ncbi:MAG: hypothetical protein R2734_08645 [Nocardioides sp.]